MRKKYFLVFIKRKKTEFILSSKTKCAKSGIFTNNYWVGWVGKVMLQVSIAVFSGKDGSAPLEKLGPYAYVTGIC